MLPFDDENGGEGDYPFNEENYNDFNENLQFDSFEDAGAFYDAVSDYFHDQGFSNDDWMDMITEVNNFEYWYDEDGELHYDLDFDWWYDEGGYGGHASASG